MTLNKEAGMRITTLLFVTVITISACSSKHKIKGPEFIEKDVLVKVMSDIYIMNGMTNDMSYYRKFDPVDSVDLFSSIFEKYNIDSEKYERTIQEYSKYPELLDNVYDEVLMNLSQIQDTLDEGMGIETR